MNKILFLTENSENIERVTKVIISTGIKVIPFHDISKLSEELEINDYDLILFDVFFFEKEFVSYLAKIKMNLSNKSIPIIALLNQKTDIPVDYSEVFDFFITDENMIINVIKSAIRIKNSTEVLLKNNRELSKSLYQLDVLYNISTKLAGSLNKQKLIEIMIEGVEKTLSFDLSYTFLFNKDEVLLIINSLYPLTERFEEAIKLRATLNYQSMLNENTRQNFKDIDEITIKKNIKHNLNEYDLNVFRFDSLFTKINLGDNLYGLMEIFRKDEFTQDDLTCFQSLSKQVAIPLESANLYEEIKLTNEKLEKLERMKSEFISIVSHELRTPLTALKNSLDIINSQKAGKTTEAQNKFLDMAKRNVVRLSGIINDLLDLSKVEAGKMEFRYEISKIINTIDIVKSSLENIAKEKNIQIDLELQDETSNLYIDNQRIEQVLTNLISNAIKFTPENGIIKIKTEIVNAELIKTKKLIQQNLSPENLNYLKISVIDNGIGISEEDTIKIFDKFQQIENSLNRNIGGTGLGIPIAKQLVEAHLGFIWVESEINVGTDFSIALPIATDEVVFKVDFLNMLSKAKVKNSTVGIFSLKEPLNSSINLIEKIINNELEIIKRTDNYKYIVKSDTNNKIYFLCIPDADEFLLNFIFQRISTFIKDVDSNVDIMYSKAMYPDDGLEPAEIFSELDKNYKYLNIDRKGISYA